MKRIAARSPQTRELACAWREAEHAAFEDDVADQCDDRVSENIFDIDDEHDEVEGILHGSAYDVDWAAPPFAAAVRTWA